VVEILVGRAGLEPATKGL